MSDNALPPHLRGRLHNDWPWPFNKISRGWNAKGPRPGKFASDFLTWPPRLERGAGVARWESSGGNSILFIPGLENVEINGVMFYNRRWLVTEMNPGHPDFLKSKDMFFPEWQPCRVFDTSNGDGTWTQHCEPEMYSPSALQKFSKKGWMKLSPAYHSEWNYNNLKERKWLEAGAKGESPEDRVAFFRRFNRPDHVDLYYNTDKWLPIGFAGLKWE